MSTAASEAGTNAGAVDRLREMGIAYLGFAEREPALFDVMWRKEICHADDEALQEAAGGAFVALVGAIASAREEG